MSGSYKFIFLCLFFLFAGILIACGSYTSQEQAPTLMVESTVTTAPTSTAADTLDTKFEIASITKSFTAMAIMILEERGLLNVGDPICQYLSDCPETWQAVRIHHLLTHTSGIPDYTDLSEYGQIDIEWSREYTTEQVNVFFNQQPLIFVSGSQWRYSNSGNFLLGKILENVAGQSYEDFLQENILQPLEMEDTGYIDRQQILKNRASGYSLSQETFTDINLPYSDSSTKFSAGALYSTVEDLIKWDQAFYANNLVSEETFEKIIFHPQCKPLMMISKKSFSREINDSHTDF